MRRIRNMRFIISLFVGFLFTGFLAYYLYDSNECIAVHKVPDTFQPAIRPALPEISGAFINDTIAYIPRSDVFRRSIPSEKITEIPLNERIQIIGLVIVGCPLLWKAVVQMEFGARIAIENCETGDYLWVNIPGVTPDGQWELNFCETNAASSFGDQKLLIHHTGHRGDWSSSLGTPSVRLELCLRIRGLSNEIFLLRNQSFCVDGNQIRWIDYDEQSGVIVIKVTTLDGAVLRLSEKVKIVNNDEYEKNAY
jgi:hypothetical protein